MSATVATAIRPHDATPHDTKMPAMERDTPLLFIMPNLLSHFIRV
jgi:hypothetical protein